MAELHYTPDAPFRSGVTGKYKLLIKSVSKKYAEYEYELVDAEGKEYKAASNAHYPENQLLRCILTFAVSHAQLVVTETAICKKQDLAEPVQEPKRTIPTSQPAPQAKPPKKPTVFTQIDEIQNNGQKAGPMSEDEIQNLLKQIEQRKDSRNASYRCCGKTHHGIYEFRKHLYVCHPEEYSRYFSPVLHRDAPASVRGVGVGVHKKTKKKKGYSKNDDAYPTRCKGDYFHLIYTPMGNKR